MQASFSICEKGRNHDSLSLTLSPSNQPAIMPRRSPFHRKVVLVFSICTLVWIWGCAFFFGLPEVKVDLPMEPVVSVDALFAGLSEHAMVDTTTEYHSNTKKITSNETTTSNQTTVVTKWTTTAVDSLMPDIVADNSSLSSSSSSLLYNNTPEKIDQSMYNMGVSITLQDIKDFVAGTIVDTIVNKHGQNFHQKPIINRYNSSIPFKSNNNNTVPPVDCLSARLLISFIEASSDPLDKSLQAAAFRDEVALFKATISKSCNISRTATGRNETGNKEANKENFTGSRKYYFCSSINVKGGKSGANKSDQLTWLTQWLNKWVTPEEAELLLDVYSVGLQAAHLLFYLLLIPVVIAFYFKLLDRYFESPPPSPPPMANGKCTISVFVCIS